MFETLDRIGGSLVNLVLGGLVLWVGQTTFHHAGQLATVDQKFTAVDKQFANFGERYESMRSWIEKALTSIKDSSRNNFTNTDADKLATQLTKLDDAVTKTERRLTDQLTAVEVKIAALESRGQNSQELTALEVEVAQLRAALAQAISTPPAAAYQPPTNVAQVQPLYLPPVTTRR